ncbi:hypothetical protein BRCON_2742 [Candidatus Sumerlaea chitinivorans]|uniref:Uncharacterized protein n=1 Tax=Sumerlaea chitinivorans TaxID=2250252 RepID=A0A2Z4Y8A5_SUMC1|nr:hypothetical protein BRCON_2742 [Candidatus Sumerlaea chitinivorans]
MESFILASSRREGADGSPLLVPLRKPKKRCPMVSYGACEV